MDIPACQLFNVYASHAEDELHFVSELQAKLPTKH